MALAAKTCACKTQGTCRGCASSRCFGEHCLLALQLQSRAVSACGFCGAAGVSPPRFAHTMQVWDPLHLQGDLAVLAFAWHLLAHGICTEQDEL